MAITLATLYQLLRNNVKWKLTPAEAKAFQASKELLTSDSLLVYYDPTKDPSLLLKLRR